MASREVKPIKHSLSNDMKKSLLVAQVYVDDIVFGSTIDNFAQEFSEEMKKEFEVSMVGELNYFLGLQVKQRKDVIFIS